MADLQQTPLGWRTISPDGSEIHLPEDVARDVFPDFFEDAPAPAVQLPLPEPEPVVAEPDPNQHRPPVADQLAQGQLPAGASSASYSYSGTRPRPAVKQGLIDVESVGQLGNALIHQVAEGADQLTAAKANKAAVQMQADEAAVPFADEKVRVQREFEAAEAERHARAAEELAADEQRIAEAIAAVPQTNPGQYWQNMDGFTSGIATLTMMMGSLAGGGKSNQVADFALQLVDRDMRAQEANIATAKAKVGFAQDAYTRRSQKAYYDKLDLQEAKILKLETLAAGLEAQGARFKSKLTQAEFAENAAILRMERDKAIAEYAQTRQRDMLGAMQTNLQLKEQRAARADANARFKEQMRVQAAKDEAEAKSKAAESQFFLRDPQVAGRRFMVDPSITSTIDKGEFAKVRDNFARDASALAVAKQYAARMNEVGSIIRLGGDNKLNPDSAEYVELNRLRETALNEIRHATAGAALTEHEIKNWEKILSKPTTVLSQNALDDVVGFVDLYGQRVQRKYVNTYGLVEVDPNGNATTPDLAKEWGSIDLESTKAPDAAELHVRMGETAKGIQLETPPKRPDTFTPSEPPLGATSKAYTGEGPQAKTETPDSVRRIVKDAETFKYYLDKAPRETGMTPDLVSARAKSLEDEAMSLFVAGYDDEAERLMRIRKEIIDLHNTDYNTSVKAKKEQSYRPVGGGRVVQ